MKFPGMFFASAPTAGRSVYAEPEPTHLLSTSDDRPHEGVVVLGCGNMGRDIAALFARNRRNVQAVARNPERWTQYHEGIERAIAELPPTSQRGNVIFHAALASVNWHGVGLVVETIAEDLDAKIALFAELDATVPSEAIIVSNSSSYGIAKFTASCKTAARMANLHFFAPAHLVPLVEVVPSEVTAEAVVGNLVNTTHELGCRPVRVRCNMPGFLANRLQHALMREAWGILDEGFASADMIDAAARNHLAADFIASGPLRRAEEEGLQLELLAARRIYPQLHTNSAPSPTLERLVVSGKTGADAGDGLWQWTPQRVARARAEYAQKLKEILPRLQQAPLTTPKNEAARAIEECDADERIIAERLRHALTREAWAMLEQGAASSDDIDTAVRFGFGFRYAAAGPLMQKELTGLHTQLAAAREIYGSLEIANRPSRILEKRAGVT